MDARADALKLEIAHYRRLLAEGVPGDIARAYLLRLAAAHAELAAIEERRKSLSE